MEADKSVKQENVIEEKSLAFAVRIVKLSRYLRKEKREPELCSQILRSGTSVGANVAEALKGFSRKDFIAKLQIALKEANETRYWLTLMMRSEILTQQEGSGLQEDCEELIRILTAILKSSKEEKQGNNS